MNHCWRCSEEPCVQLSGVTRPWTACLDPVVTDRSGGVERVGDVGLRELLDEAGLDCVARPDSREAVRLELDAHGPALRALVLRAAEDAQEILDVVAVLVGHHVGLRERPSLGAEVLAELVEEAEVDVDVLIGGAVEGPHRR